MFSSLPKPMGQFSIECPEFVFHLYMPIKMRHNDDLRIPPHLSCFGPLVEAVMRLGVRSEDFVYLTVKRMHVPRGGDANRPGWHIDGYGSDDKNFIWSDSLPTEFVSGHFSLSNDHEASLMEMGAQASGLPIITYPENTLLALDATNIHRVAVCHADHVRTFCKISVSGERYNLVGNAHNYLFGYDWPMMARTAERNHPVGRQS